MSVIRFAVLGIVTVLLGIFLKECRKEYALYLSLATGVLMIIAVSDKLLYLVSQIREIQKRLPVDTAYVSILLKIIGITYLAQFSSELCRDAGFSAVASQIDLFSKVTILVLCVPILLALVETITGFLA